MDAAARQSLKLNENAMDTSPSVLGKRDRSTAGPTNIESSSQVAEGKRSRGDAAATTLALDLAVAHAQPQWRSPDLESKMEASPSTVAEGVDGAISAWVADECKRKSGQE